MPTCTLSHEGLPGVGCWVVLASPLQRPHLQHVWNGKTRIIMSHSAVAHTTECHGWHMLFFVVVFIPCLLQSNTLHCVKSGTFHCAAHGPFWRETQREEDWRRTGTSEERGDGFDDAQVCVWEKEKDRERKRVNEMERPERKMSEGSPVFDRTPFSYWSDGEGVISWNKEHSFEIMVLAIGFL